MSKKFIFFLLGLLLLCSSACSSRAGPALLANQNIQQTQEQVVDVESLDAGESCDGVGEEECLVRRTLVAHVDYIYTQRHKNP